MRVLSLDPSVNNVGYCLFKSTKKKVRNAFRWGVWHIEGDSLMSRLIDLKDRINDDIGHFDILIVEWPMFFDGNKGHIAARKGYTIDLAAVCMFIAGWFHMNHRNCFPITAATWKGQVSKEVTARKFSRLFKIDLNTVSEHAVDATVMLHWWLNRFGRAAFRVAHADFPESLLLQIETGKLPSS